MDAVQSIAERELGHLRTQARWSGWPGLAAGEGGVGLPEVLMKIIPDRGVS